MAIPRRVVTGVRNGRSVFLSDGPPANGHVYAGIPGFTTSVVWATSGPPDLPLGGEEPAPPGVTITPAPGDTRLMIVTLPPDAVFAGPEFDPAQAAEEQAQHLPGLAECFEAEDPGMHATLSVDYGVVVDGEIWLELDDGAEVHLKQGDTVVQGGARHAWRNRSDRPTTMAFILIGAASDEPFHRAR